MKEKIGELVRLNIVKIKRYSLSLSYEPLCWNLPQEGYCAL